MILRGLLVALVSLILPLQASAQATGRMSEVVTALAAAHDNDVPPFVYLALRAELDELLAEDPMGEAARRLFEEGKIEAEDGSVYTILNSGIEDWLAAAKREPLLRMDRAVFLAEAISVPFGRSDVIFGSCLSRLAFELEFRAPRNQLEADLVAAAPALVETTRLSYVVMNTHRAAVLSGEAPPFGHEDWGKDTTGLDVRQQMLSALVFLGPESQSRFAEPYFFSNMVTGEAYPPEEILAAFNGLTEEDWAMVRAAQPFQRTLIQMFETGVSDPAEVYCRP